MAAGTLVELNMVQPLADIATAMLSKYGAYDESTNPTGYNELSQTASYLIFTCAAISNKYCKLYWSGANLYAYHGTGYVSGTALTGEVNFGGNSNYPMTGIKVVLFAESSFILTTGSASDNDRGKIKFIIFSKLSNGDYYLCGAIHSTYSMDSYSCLNTTTGQGMAPLAVSTTFLSDTGKIMVGDVIMRICSSNRLYKSGDSFVTLPNVKMATYGSHDAVTVGTGYIITFGDMYACSGGIWYAITSGSNGMLIEVA